MADSGGTVEEAPARTGGANATIVIAIILVGASLYVLHGLIAPFLAAAFLLIVIGGLSRFIRKAAPALPRSTAMGIAVVLILGALAGAVWTTIDNVARLIADAQIYAQRVSEAVFRMQAAAGIDVPRQLETILRGVDASRVAAIVAGWLQVALTSSGFMLIYLGFMMASGRTFTRKLLAITGARAGFDDAQVLFEHIREASAGTSGCKQRRVW